MLVELDKKVSSVSRVHNRFFTLRRALNMFPFSIQSCIIPLPFMHGIHFHVSWMNSECSWFAIARSLAVSWWTIVARRLYVRLLMFRKTKRMRRLKTRERSSKFRQLEASPNWSSIISQTRVIISSFFHVYAPASTRQYEECSVKHVLWTWTNNSYKCFNLLLSLNIINIYQKKIRCAIHTLNTTSPSQW